ncbi:type I methionyl aminopeptidase [bacterium]|nr:type I methionyl aminopeptidase [bacterium]
MIPIKSKRELEIMRENGALLNSILEGVKRLAKPGVVTQKLDQYAEERIFECGAVPAFKGYRGYSAVLCTSINDEVVHGIPSSRRKIRSGDILSLDLGLKRNGYFSDMAVTIPIGEVSDDVVEFLKITEYSLMEGIKQARVGNRLGDISHAVQEFVERQGFSVVRDFVGHGIGVELHEEPPLPNFGPPHQGPRLEAGMVLAIEPMVNVGSHQVKVLSDQWTVVTVDGTLSAHFEHSVAVTEDGPKILTEPLNKG